MVLGCAGLALDRCADPSDGAQVDLYRDGSIAPP